MAVDTKGIVAVFRIHTAKSDQKSKEQGRPIFEDIEVCELRFAGSKAVSVFPATAFSHWDRDEETGEQRQVTYVEWFPRQYQQFKAKAQQTKEGTPLDYLPFLTEAKRAELRALNIYTAEALTVVDGPELKNLGPGGRELKNHAIEYLENSVGEARITRLEAELEAIKARNRVLEGDVKAREAQAKDPTGYDGMSDDQLREHLRSTTGIDPKGNLPRKTLIRMAQEQKEAAA
jgi:hypothetical protein